MFAGSEAGAGIAADIDLGAATREARFKRARRFQTGRSPERFERAARRAQARSSRVAGNSRSGFGLPAVRQLFESESGAIARGCIDRFRIARPRLSFRLPRAWPRGRLRSRRPACPRTPAGRVHQAQSLVRRSSRTLGRFAAARRRRSHAYPVRRYSPAVSHGLHGRARARRPGARLVWTPAARFAAALHSDPIPEG
ncbi:hypothetical protein [Burkholderia pseudomallei]|uniref:hypothetical protein n=1 Tax=Burkholderia pseudomallei TaxID=28450 RepID=UPI000AC1DBC0|nr:hypothetical protein [Burkholderia pseudomallei]